MTYLKLRLLLWLILLPVASYWLFSFFTRLSGVNMFRAVAMSFRLDSSVPGIHRASAILGFAMFLFLVVALFLYIETPKQIYDLSRYHAGGLTGYNRDFMHTMLYDPLKGGYVEYYLWGVPAVAERFTEAFETVLIYRTPSQEYWQDTSFMGLGAAIMRLIIVIISIPVVYICLYLLADSYQKDDNPGITIDHRAIAENFMEITGQPYWKAALVLISVLLAISFISAVWVEALNCRYNSPFKAEQQSLRSALFHNVSPGDTVRGRVIQRFKNRYESSIEKPSAGKKPEVYHYIMMHYTVEFRDLVRVPVYLKLIYAPGSGESDILEKPFVGNTGSEPETPGEYDFTVNDDYSVSLKIKR